MFIQKLTLDNFQSHKHTELLFSDGFTCIVGKTRSGKSSVVRALQFLLYDTWSTSFIRKKKTSVTVTALLSTGVTVARSKGEKVNRIVVTQPDGTEQVFENFGVASPPAVKALLQVSPVRIDHDTAVDVNIADQDEPAFLLSESAPMKTKYLNRLTGAHILDAARRTASTELTRVQTSLAQASAQRDATLRDIAASTVSDTLRAQAQEYSKHAESIVARYNTLAALQETRQKITELRAALTHKTDLLNCVAKRVAVLDMCEKRLSLVDTCMKAQTIKARLESLLAKQIENGRALAALAAKITVCPTCGSMLSAGAS